MGIMYSSRHRVPMNNKTVEATIERAEKRNGNTSNSVSYLPAFLLMCLPIFTHPISLSQLANCQEYPALSIGRKNTVVNTVNKIAVTEYPPKIIPACVGVKDHLNSNRPKTSTSVENTILICMATALLGFFNSFSISCILLLEEKIIKT